MFWVYDQKNGRKHNKAGSVYRKFPFIFFFCIRWLGGRKKFVKFQSVTNFRLKIFRGTKVSYENRISHFPGIRILISYSGKSFKKLLFHGKYLLENIYL